MPILSASVRALSKCKINPPLIPNSVYVFKKLPSDSVDIKGFVTKGSPLKDKSGLSKAGNFENLNDFCLKFVTIPSVGLVPGFVTPSNKGVTEVL